MPRPKIFGAPANGLRGGLAALPHSPTPNDDECLEPESMRWFGWMPRGRDRQDRSRAWTCRRPYAEREVAICGAACAILSPEKVT
jgi:hypothetical protein